MKADFISHAVQCQKPRCIILRVELKVAAISKGLQTRFTKVFDFYAFETLVQMMTITKKSWPSRNELNPESKNVVNPSLVSPDKITFPPGILHVNWDL